MHVIRIAVYGFIKATCVLAFLMSARLFVEVRPFAATRVKEMAIVSLAIVLIAAVFASVDIRIQRGSIKAHRHYERFLPPEGVAFAWTCVAFALGLGTTFVVLR